MKYLIVAAVVAVVCCSVQAHRGGGGSRERGGFGGYSSESSSSFEEIGRCDCQIKKGKSRVCYSVSATAGTVIKGCPNTNSFIQCQSTACTVVACPAGQVWDKTTSACAACATGMHLRADLQACVCDRGTTYNRKTGQCVECPTRATIEADRCFCPLTLVLDPTATQCKACPTGTTLDRDADSCKCAYSTPRLYWSASEWLCKGCPGVTSTRRIGRWNSEEVCTCTGTNEIFDRRSVSCYACPATITTPDRKGMRCMCNILFQRFDWATKTCQCIKGFVLNDAQTACVLATAAATTTPSKINP